MTTVFASARKPKVEGLDYAAAIKRVLMIPSDVVWSAKFSK